MEIHEKDRTVPVLVILLRVTILADYGDLNHVEDYLNSENGIVLVKLISATIYYLLSKS